MREHILFYWIVKLTEFKNQIRRCNRGPFIIQKYRQDDKPQKSMRDESWIVVLLLFSCSVMSDSFETLWTVACQAPLPMGGISPVKTEGQPGFTEILVSETAVIHSWRSEGMRNYGLFGRFCCLSVQRENKIVLSWEVSHCRNVRGRGNYSGSVH